MFSDIVVKLLTLESTEYLSCACLLVNFEPEGSNSAASNFGDLLELLALLAVLVQGDNVAYLNSVGRDINSLAVHTEMTVRNELTSFASCASHAHSENNVVESGLEELQKVLTGDALFLGSQLIVVVELLLENAVDELELLLLLELGSVLRFLLSLVAVGVSVGLLVIAQNCGAEIKCSASL